MDLPSFPASNHPILLGSASQAIDFWPGPSDLKDWTWSQYTKYVTTSLDSFNTKLSESVLQLYPPYIESNHLTTWVTTPSGNSSHFKNLNDHQKDVDSEPEAMYARMVSDVRQTCPLNKISEQISNSNHNPLYRYIITNRPSKMVIQFYPTFLLERKDIFHLLEIAIGSNVGMTVEY